VAVHVERGRVRRAAGADRRDGAAAQRHGALDDLAGQHHAGVGQNDVLDHAASWNWRYAASCNGNTSNNRSAMAFRTSTSWHMAMIAVPRAFASRIIPTTPSWLAASSEAVG